MTATKTIDAYAIESDKRKQLFNLLNSFSAEKSNFIAIEDIDDAYKAECDKIVKHTAMTLKTMSNAYYKTRPCLETQDVEQIKNALANYAKNDARIVKFKDALITDLSKIQKQISECHALRIKKLQHEKAVCLNQINVLDHKKHKLIMERLSKIQWPYDTKTTEFDKTIASLKLKIENYERKISETMTMRPFADEKEVLIFQMQLKEKYIG